MSRQRIGDLLRQHVALSAHDIDEILHEQSHTRQSFGDVAISLGKCSPQDVWRAWCEQIKDSIEHVDLDRLGIDAQAIGLVPRELAVSLSAVPIRCTQTHLVIATSDAMFNEATVVLPARIEARIRFVIAPLEQIQAALAKYYPPATASA